MISKYRLGSRSLLERPNENLVKPKRVIFLSTEGTKTEIQYFNFIEKYREELNIDAIVHIEVLRRYDTYSDPENILNLLEEYIYFRENNMFEHIIESLALKDYDIDFIRAYLYEPTTLSKTACRKFKGVLNEEQIDLSYLDFLNRYKGDEDAFGIVLDRDYCNHSTAQMQGVINKCQAKKYLYYISNPCIEFWQLLHVSDVKSEYAKSLDDILRNELDEKKNSLVSNLLYEKTGQRKAIQEKTFQKYYLPNIDFAIECAKKFAPREQLLDELGTNLWELIELLRE